MADQGCARAVGCWGATAGLAAADRGRAGTGEGTDIAGIADCGAYLGSWCGRSLELGYSLRLSPMVAP